MELSYGQIYITLQCGPTSGCTEPNVISFKVKTHCAFTSRALIPGVLELAKGSDVICESVLHSVKLTLQHRSHLERWRDECFCLLYCPPRGSEGTRRNRGCLKAFRPDFRPVWTVADKHYKSSYLQGKASEATSGSAVLVNKPLRGVALSNLNRCAILFPSSGGSIAHTSSPVTRLLPEN